LAFSSDESFSIDNLKDISFNIISLLKKSGFFSLKDLIVRGPFEVSSETGIDIDDSFLIFNQALTALEDIGLVEKQSAGVELSMCQNITVSHNTIYDLPRAGINVSEGTWGGHVIEYNDVFNTVIITAIQSQQK